MSTMQTAPLRLKHRRASEGLLKNSTSTTSTRFIDFGDAAQHHQPPSLSNPRTHEMRTLLIDSMQQQQHPKRSATALPTTQQQRLPARTAFNAIPSASSHANGASHLSSGESSAGESSSCSPSIVSAAHSPEFRSLLGNLEAKKKSLHQYERNGSGGGMIPTSITTVGGSGIARGGGSATATSVVNAKSNSSINQALSSSTSSQQLGNGFATSSSSTSSSSTHTSHATSSSSSHVHMSSKEIKEQPLYRDIANMKSSMAEMKSLASNSSMSNLRERLRASRENLLDAQQHVTFPDDDSDEACSTVSDLMSPPPVTCSGDIQLQMPGGLLMARGADTVTFKKESSSSASQRKVITDGFSSEQATSNATEMQHLQAGDVDYKEETAAAAVRKKIEVNGVTAEQQAAAVQEARTFKSGDVQQQETNNRAASHTSIHSDTFSAQNSARAQSQQRQTVTAAGGQINHEQNFSSSSKSNFSMSSRGMLNANSASQMSAINGMLNGMGMPCFDDLERLTSATDVEAAIQKYGQILNVNVNSMRENSGGSTTDKDGKDVPDVLNSINQVIQRAWSVPTYGHQLGYGLCNRLRESGGLDLLVSNCVGQDRDLQFSSARLLEQCLTTENRSHVVEHGLEKVVNVACFCTNIKNTKEPDHSRVGTGILEHLFKHSEDTCSDVINLGGLDAVLFECRKNDVETLRHCAMALANLSLYGGAENQAAMINRKVPMWLFPLAFHDDDNIKYYACLAIAVLVANKEIEAEVLKSGTLDLVEPFVMTHNPSEFAKSNLAHAHGQSKQWLKRLVPVLSSNREEARNLAAFHLCMEAGIKREQQLTDIFREIGAVEPLKTVASCPNAVASKFAAQALRLIGEEVPHKLSQQVPLWSVEDVSEWVKQIGFGSYGADFSESRVDGDLLLQLTDENIRDDIGIRNGIHRQRFRRELAALMKMADYSSKDAACLNAILQNIGPEFSIYTYPMLNAGVDKEALRTISESQLINECGITNSIHRLRILNSTKSDVPYEPPTSLEKTLDVFVSYRRSNGSQLASLLKVHLQLRGFTVFIDVERLEAGKFDINLLNSIKQAKHFILVLTENTLDRCINDNDCNDWVHKEIVAALSSECNIIPIIDNFNWPEVDVLPDDMRTVCHFNAVRWIHDYQDACVDKLERFMRGERDAAPNIFRTPAGAGNNSAGIQQPPPLRNPVNYQRMASTDSDSADPASLGSGRVSD